MLRVPRNCQVAGDNPRAVTVVAGQTTELSAFITCVATTGVLRVTTVTTGVDLDPDAYQLRGEGYTVVAFASDRSGRMAGNTDVYVMNADGSNPVRLTTNGGAQPAWSRDGRLAYAAPDCLDFSCQPTIYVRSPSGADNPVPVGPGDRPTWSPDGRKIAYDALHCDFYFYRCVPGTVGIGRLDTIDVITLGNGMRPAWWPGTTAASNERASKTRLTARQR